MIEEQAGLHTSFVRCLPGSFGDSPVLLLALRFDPDTTFGTSGSLQNFQQSRLGVSPIVTFEAAQVANRALTLEADQIGITLRRRGS